MPLSASSIRKLIGLLAAILDDAFEDELIERNPARGKRMRVRVPKPDRSFLELDELAALIEAAAAQDALPSLLLDGDSSRDRVARLVAAGRRPKDIAAELRLAKATVSHHLARLGIDQGSGYLGRRAVIEILGRSGVRASELCDLRVRDVRLHDPDGARFHIRDSKTEAGVREVQMSPDLVEAIVEHLDRLRRAGLPTRPDAYLVPIAAAGGCRASGSARPWRRRLRWRPSGSPHAVCRRCRTSRRTACGAPTSRSRCSPTTSTSSG